MRSLFIGSLAALLVACNRNENQGGTPADNNLHAGRGSGEVINTNGTPAPAQRPGPPDVNYSDKSGSGRIDQGGGSTAGAKPESLPSTNVSSAPGTRSP